MDGPPVVVVAGSELPYAPADLFGTRTGELFVIRTPDPRLAEPAVLAAVERAVEQYDARLVLVLVKLSTAQPEPAELQTAWASLDQDLQQGWRQSPTLRDEADLGLELVGALCLEPNGKVLFGTSVAPPTDDPKVEPTGLERVLAATLRVEAYSAAATPAPAVGPASPRRRTGAGAAFLFDAVAHLAVTARHVIAGAETILVSSRDGHSLAAVPVGEDPSTDVAVLRLPGLAAPAVVTEPASMLKLGQPVLAVGHPFDAFPFSVTSGVVSALGRSFSAEGRAYDGLIQTDAGLQPGSSGGPLCKPGGQVVGLNVALYAPGGIPCGIGFALPIEDVLLQARHLVVDGCLPWLGAQLATLTPALAGELGLPQPGGVVVLSLAPGGPAETAGLRQLDRLVSVEHLPVASRGELRRGLLAVGLGDRVMLEVERGTARTELGVVLQRRPDRPGAEW